MNDQPAACSLSMMWQHGEASTMLSCQLRIHSLHLQAIMESQSNPLAIMNYQDDPDVMLVSNS